MSEHCDKMSELFSVFMTSPVRAKVPASPPFPCSFGRTGNEAFSLVDPENASGSWKRFFMWKRSSFHAEDVEAEEAAFINLSNKSWFH